MMPWACSSMCKDFASTMSLLGRSMSVFCGVRGWGLCMCVVVKSFVVDFVVVLGHENSFGWRVFNVVILFPFSHSTL